MTTLGVLTFNVSKVGGQTEDVTLTVTFVGGGSSLDFGRLRNLEEDGKPTSESATRQLRLLIQPAQGNNRPYIVTQVFIQEPSHERGGRVSPNSILYRVDEETGTGTIRVPSETPFGSGEQEIYRSAPTGGQSQLLVTFDLMASAEQEAGSYEGTIEYRVSLI